MEPNGGWLSDVLGALGGASFMWSPPGSGKRLRSGQRGDENRSALSHVGFPQHLTPYSLQSAFERDLLETTRLSF